MNFIKIKDKEFKISIPSREIETTVYRIATEINQDYENKQLLFISILNGSFMFTADLLKLITVDCEISFVKVSSYSKLKTTTKVKSLIGLNEDIDGKDVIIIEDIVDTGNTLENIYNTIKIFNPNSIKIASLLLKPDVYKKNVPIDYVGYKIPIDFVVGYGMDYDGKGRNLKDIFTIV